MGNGHWNPGKDLEFYYGTRVDTPGVRAVALNKTQHIFIYTYYQDIIDIME